MNTYKVEVCGKYGTRFTRTTKAHTAEEAGRQVMVMSRFPKSNKIVSVTQIDGI